MTTNPPQAGATSAAMKRLPTSNGQGPTTPAGSFAVNQAGSTPRSNTPIPFASPSFRFGTPRKGMLGGKTFAGSAQAGLTPNSSFNFNLASPNLSIASPMVVGLSVPGLDSLAGFPAASPNGLGFGALDGGVGMSMSLSNLGIDMSTQMSTGGTATGRVDDAERRRRLLAVLETVGGKSGRVSKEGLERVGRRCELEMLQEPRKVVMAGKALLVDIEFDSKRPEFVTQVVLELEASSDAMSEHTERAAQILQEDLTPEPGISSISATLDKFADNLARLASMDRLNVPGANCFDAIFGVYTSLKRLHDHERTIAAAILEASQVSKADVEVLRKKSGRPGMHLRRRVGMSVDYWTSKANALPAERSAKRQKPNEISPDGTRSATGDTAMSTLIIECERSVPALYQPIRISSDWISEQVVRPISHQDNLADSMLLNVNTLSQLDWLQPPAAIIKAEDETAAEIDITGLTSQPHIRFVARLEPPVAFPMTIAMNIFTSFGVDDAHDILSSSQTLADLILTSSKWTTNAGNIWQFENITSSGTVTPPSERVTESTSISMHWTKPGMGKIIETLPFSHPQQLINLLPLLRQYTFTQRLLRNTFVSPQIKPSKQEAPSKHTNKGTRLRRPVTSTKKVTEMELARLLEPIPEKRNGIDISFTMSPMPQMVVRFNTNVGIKHFTFNILYNAEIHVVKQDIVADDEDEARRQKRIDALVKALEITEDIGIWAEWVRRKYSKESEEHDG